jgi:electron transport complex protein RnfE
MMEKNKKTPHVLWGDFIKGLWKENPVFRLLLGMCPTLAVSTSVANCITMGLAVLFVLVCSSTLTSSLRNVIPREVRIPSFIIIIASFVTIVDLFLKAYLPALSKALGPFVPLIVVNCIIMERAEIFASKNPVHRAFADAFGMGIGFTLSLSVLGSVREILGRGTWLGMSVMPASSVKTVLMLLPPGAFLTLGLLAGLFNWLDNRMKEEKK